MSRSDVAVVVIGRNEGARLERCLRSVGGLRTIYVDSASDDGSVGRALAAGAEVVELDAGSGLSAARGRNAGLARLTGDPAIAYVQMLDGDCELAPGWIDAAAAALDAEAGLGAVIGQLRERDPGASIYNWMCDVEWSVPPGPARVFGGNALLRSEAARRTGGYLSTMIAGEDPEFAIRMRAAGWSITALAAPMAVHDAATFRFAQWWRRAVRSGHAFAELVQRHPHSPLHDFARSRRRILFWGGAVPMAALAGLTLAALVDPHWLALAIGALLLVAAQWLRIGLREARRHPVPKAFALASFLTLGKYAEMIGLLRFHLAREPRLIEHKRP